MTDADLDLGYDLTITKVTRRACGSGTWICGTLHGHRLDTLVFPEHATDAEFELAFQFGLSKVFAIVTIADILFVLPHPVKLFWHEIIWKRYSGPSSERASEVSIGIALAVVSVRSVAVGELLKR